MTTAPVHGATFRVVDDSDDVVLPGRVPRHTTGSWSPRYPAVYRLDLSRLQSPGRYRIEATGAARRPARPGSACAAPATSSGRCCAPAWRSTATSATARTSSPGRSTAGRPTCTTAHASVYRWPRMQHGSDLILDRRLHRIGGPVDVSGGWFDAGDYLKFTHSTAYNDVLLFTSARLLGHRAPAELVAEATARAAVAGEDVARAAPARCSSRSGSARATGPARSAATTTSGGCPRPTTATPGTPTASSPTGRCSAPRRRDTGSAPTWSAGCRRRSPWPHSRTPARDPARARRRAPAGASPLRPRGDGAPAPPAGDRPPPRLLPGVDLARRHAARRRRDRPGGTPPGTTGERRYLRDSAHWARGFIAAPQHRHAQPLRHGGARRLLAGRRAATASRTAGWP